ncbi:NAD(P)H-hydrate dehydratase [Pseudomonas sp. gcc21]|uniref:NAD(P)H-hydrate dehydratase n=1 Tax=Pseudomonas sp. gcc21 TaxID=2726989 RepID=UPI0014523944|nr:NAD(P)H-hydrate dehydratase [Pseudomonas sp. gcc21]QJD58981.1 NAD(P)H-hydrate dehydratase [Pseudomonas sp. gcc21]
MTSEMPFGICTAAQTRELDARIIAAGTPGFELMQRAAEAVWQTLSVRWAAVGQLSVLAGSGNNAGDGYLVARLAHNAGWQVRVLAVKPPERLQGDAAKAWQTALAAGVEVLAWSASAHLKGVVVDAMLGTGVRGDVSEPYKSVIEAVNASGLPVVAVDVPSGLDPDRGVVLGHAIRANLTVTFIAPKLGLFTAQGPDQAGDIAFAQLEEVPGASVRPVAERLVLERLASSLPRRVRAAHKGMFGHVLVIGGDLGMGGAIMLAAETALRSGAGRVSVATRSAHIAPLLARCPEVMAHAVDSPEALSPLLKKATTLVVGPGLGRSEWGWGLLDQALASGLSRVFDADALNEIAVRHRDGLLLGDQTVITPHPAEAGRLLGCSTAEVQADRLRAVTMLADRFGCAVILKGVGSLVAGPACFAAPVGLCTHGNPGMAVAGMGDVLSGLVGALLAQQVEPGSAARYATLIHAQAGDCAAVSGESGILASDLIGPIRTILNTRGSHE